MAQKKNIFFRIGDVAMRAETAIASVAFSLMCVFVLMTIVYRYVLKAPIMWTEEASRYLMITGIFIAMPVAVREHVHLGVDIVINAVPKASRKIFHIFSDFVTLAAYVAIDYACYLFVAKAMAGSQTSPAMHMPMVWIYAVILTGFILGTIVQVTNMLGAYIKKTPPNDEEVML